MICAQSKQAPSLEEKQYNKYIVYWRLSESRSPRGDFVELCYRILKGLQLSTVATSRVVQGGIPLKMYNPMAI
jgi:hypothetical protein